MAPPRRSLRLARELALEQSAKLDDRHVTNNVLRHLCELADEKATSGDRDCMRLARLCCRIAFRLGTGEARARSFALLATALWLQGRLEKADRALNLGIEAAPTFLDGDLLRRRAFLRLYQDRVPEAVQDAKAAVRRTEQAAKALSLEVLGIALAQSGDYRGAIREHARCLEQTDPNSPVPYNNAVHNYATSLAKGSAEEAAQGMELCKKLRERLKPRHKLQRAKLWWTEGLLLEKLADTDGAWWALNTAWRSLVALELAPEVAAIVADMARVSMRPPAVRTICDESAEVVGGIESLRGPLGALATAAREMIPEAAAALRLAASQLAPCPAV